MRSHTDSVRCLIVEDDEFKLADVKMFLEGAFANLDIVSCDSLSTSEKALRNFNFQLYIVDMSIPSHPMSKGAGSPFSLPTGGLDVLFEIQSLDGDAVCVILTQYPEIEVDGELFSLVEAERIIKDRLGIKIYGCVQYDENSDSWKSELRALLRKNENFNFGR